MECIFTLSAHKFRVRLFVVTLMQQQHLMLHGNVFKTEGWVNLEKFFLQSSCLNQGKLSSYPHKILIDCNNSFLWFSSFFEYQKTFSLSRNRREIHTQKEFSPACASVTTERCGRLCCKIRAENFCVLLGAKSLGVSLTAVLLLLFKMKWENCEVLNFTTTCDKMIIVLLPWNCYCRNLF